jgi:rfaE bifunctional protein kinase chain/domain
MRLERFQVIAEKYRDLRVVVAGDFCLDRYLEIDPAREEISIETGLPAHNVVAVRSQPGGAGTILNNLAALGLGKVYPVGFTGEDGEGFELWQALETLKGVETHNFIRAKERRTFTYTKPLVISPGKLPVELNRLDIKNWTPTPAVIVEKIIGALRKLAGEVDAIILMDQVDVAETGVITTKVLKAVGEIAEQQPDLQILADSRRGLKGYPPVCLKMNRAELSALTGAAGQLELEEIKRAAGSLARRQGRNCFVTLAGRGILGASADGTVEHVPALPVRGEIDVVGAGDAVTANLAAALGAGATLRESLEIASAAASVVIHQLGTTGTASIGEIRDLLGTERDVS